MTDEIWHDISASRASSTRPRLAEWSLLILCLLRVDVPDPVAEEGPVDGKSTEGSDDEDREQRPYRCSVHAFDGSLANRHSVEVLMLWGHKAPLCLLARDWNRSQNQDPATRADNWRPVPGWEGHYEVSDRGRVRGIDRVIIRRDGSPYTARGRLRKIQIHARTGLPYVSLNLGHRRQGRTVYLRTSQCNSCPVLNRCAEWAATLTDRQLSGVIAGVVRVHQSDRKYRGQTTAMTMNMVAAATDHAGADTRPANPPDPSGKHPTTPEGVEKSSAGPWLLRQMPSFSP